MVKGRQQQNHKKNNEDFIGSLLFKEDLID